MTQQEHNFIDGIIEKAKFLKDYFKTHSISSEKIKDFVFKSEKVLKENKKKYRIFAKKCVEYKKFYNEGKHTLPIEKELYFKKLLPTLNILKKNWHKNIKLILERQLILSKHTDL